tara:strand:- start:68 stop:718 length:651 start_codon:yes stop_codon:yes gene_type:complete
MADIFDEVSEELKQDKLIQTWKKYSKIIITLILLIIISLVSYQSYLIWKKNKIEEISKQYFEALEKLENKNYSKSQSLFLKNAQNHKNGYKMLSLFGLAESNYQNGKIDEMIMNYKAIYDDESIGIYYRNLSRILSVLKDNLSSFDQQKLLLQPILNSPSKLQILAAELEILLFIKFKKIKEAEKALDILLDRSDISFEQKNRLELINRIYKNNVF